MKNIISAKHIALIAIGLALGLGATYAMAFTAPTVAAPGGNVAAPINTGATAQTKSGNFGTLGLLNSVGTITSTGGGVRTIASGLAGSISARNFRATSNAYPGYSGGPAFEIVGQPTGWIAAQKYCLTSNPSVGIPGDPGYDCISSASGWPSLAAGTQVGQTLSWGYPTAGAWAANNALKVSADVPYPDAVSTPGVLISEGNANLNAPALGVRGKVRIEGGNPAPGKVLTVEPGSTSGVGTWQTIGSQVTMAYSTTSGRMRHFVSCGANMQVLGGGGRCTTSLGAPSSITQNMPISSSDPITNSSFWNNNSAISSTPTTDANAWMITCIDSANISVWALCMPQ